MLPLTLITVLVGACSDVPSPEVAEAPQWSITADLRIGAVDDPDYALTAVAAIAVSEDGLMYTLHPDEQVVRAFNTEGALVRTIGGRGDGPGEFRRPGNMGRHGDTLWVADQAGRIHYFSEHGDVLGTVGPGATTGPRPEPEMPLLPFQVFSNGHLVASPRIPSRLIAIGEVAARPYVRLDPDAEVVDTLALLSLENGQMAVRDPNDPMAGGAYDRQPFADAPLLRVSPAEPAFYLLDRPASRSGGASRFSITKVDLDGDTVFSRDYGYEPRAIPHSLVEDVVEAWVDAVSDVPVPTAPPRSTAERWTRQALYRPEYLPPIAELVVGRDGTLWMREWDAGTLPSWMRAEGVTAGLAANWLLADPDDGAVLGTVELPADFDLLEADRRFIWGTVRDELDVPYVVRYRLSAPDF